MNSQLTKIAFLSGAAYFCCMATAHFFSIKVPILFVYYDTPFYLITNEAQLLSHRPLHTVARATEWGEQAWPRIEFNFRRV
jgi:hypothetical protein